MTDSLPTPRRDTDAELPDSRCRTRPTVPTARVANQRHQFSLAKATDVHSVAPTGEPGTCATCRHRHDTWLPRNRHSTRPFNSWGNSRCGTALPTAGNPRPILGSLASPEQGTITRGTRDEVLDISTKGVISCIQATRSPATDAGSCSCVVGRAASGHLPYSRFPLHQIGDVRSS